MQDWIQPLPAFRADGSIVKSQNKTILRSLIGITGAMALILTLLFLIHGLPDWALVLLTAAITGMLLMWLSSPQHRAYRLQAQNASEELHFKDVIYDFVVASAKMDKREDLYNLILQKAVEAIPNAKMASLLKVTEGGHMRFEAAYGHDMDILRTVDLNVEETFSHVLTSGKYDRTVIVNDFHAFNKSILDEQTYDTLNSATSSLESIMSAPVLIDNTLWGMINIDSEIHTHFGQKHIERLGVFVNEMVKVIKLFRQQEMNTWLMNHDPLTGLLNRRHFSELLRADLSLAGEGQQTGTVVSMDLDSFKHINDSFGHLNGDQALIHFAVGFRTFLSEKDYLSRYGGDEFVAVFIGKQIPETIVLLQKIQRYFQTTPLCIGDHCEIIRFSYGLIEFGPELNDYTRIMHLSDEAMYEDKREHKAAFEI